MDLRLAFTAGPQEDGKTVKFILKIRLGLSERLVKRLKYAGQVLCNTVPVYVNAPVRDGDLIEAVIEFDESDCEVIPQEFPIEILYEDEALIAVNKQPNMVVHPTCSHPEGTVANAVMHHLLSQDVRTRIRPINRLDRDTSGILLFAKNQFVQEHLIRQMKNDTFVKEYLGIVRGRVEPTSGTIDLPIERKPDSIMLRHVSPTGSPSVTHYQVLQLFSHASLLMFRLETGRTHQIRVHCQAIGYPLLGDTLYPSLTSIPSCDHEDFLSTLMPRQALHSYRCSFLHPLTEKPLVLTAPAPADMEQALEIMKK